MGQPLPPVSAPSILPAPIRMSANTSTGVSVMSERIDMKLAEVAVARYGYRHEAEFAAGFLEEEGIPYRLQMEDATLGVAATTSATIWVRGMDVQRARDLLELEDGSTGKRLTTDRGDAPVARGGSGRAIAEGQWPALTGLERLLGASMGASLVVAGQFVTSTVPFLVSALTISGLLVALPALLGRAPRALKQLLSALTGGAP